MRTNRGQHEPIGRVFSMHHWQSIFCALLLSVFSFEASAADPATTCESVQLKTVAKYDFCRLGEESRSTIKGRAPDFTRCDDRFREKWLLAETRAGAGGCPSGDRESEIVERIVAHVDVVDALLSDTDTPGCGSPNRFLATGQTVSFGSGDDGDVRSGVALTYVDNGDGTVTDTVTGLMWEKKVAATTGPGTVCQNETGTCANPHHAVNRYTWTAASDDYQTEYDRKTVFDGAVVSIFLEQLNNRCDQDSSVECKADVQCSAIGGPCGFAGHRDWRLPNKKELESIVDAAEEYPAVAAAFHNAGCSPVCTDVTDPACSCTSNGAGFDTAYWTSTTTQREWIRAWSIESRNGNATTGNTKFAALFARAVRGGS